MTTHRKQIRSRGANRTDSPDTREESMLARWSRRKAAARSGEPAKLDASAKPSEYSASPTPPDVPAPKPPEKTDADMPPVDSLDQNSDFSQFLSPKVSEKLRQAALRKLFQLPGMNVVDGLDDYAGDYTNFIPLGNIITSDMRFQMERQAQELKKRAMASAEDADGNEQTGAEEQQTDEQQETAPASKTAGAQSNAASGAASVEDPGRSSPPGEQKSETDSKTG